MKDYWDLRFACFAIETLAGVPRFDALNALSTIRALLISVLNACSLAMKARSSRVIPVQEL
jgi:hypothetical protein